MQNYSRAGWSKLMLAALPLLTAACGASLPVLPPEPVQRAKIPPLPLRRETALSAVPVLTELFGRCSERRAELARYADDARTAGQTCQRAYDALTETTQ